MLDMIRCILNVICLFLYNWLNGKVIPILLAFVLIIPVVIQSRYMSV